MEGPDECSALAVAVPGPPHKGGPGPHKPATPKPPTTAFDAKVQLMRVAPLVATAPPSASPPREGGVFGALPPSLRLPTKVELVMAVVPPARIAPPDPGKAPAGNTDEMAPAARLPEK